MAIAVDCLRTWDDRMVVWMLLYRYVVPYDSTCFQIEPDPSQTGWRARWGAWHSERVRTLGWGFCPVCGLWYFVDFPYGARVPYSVCECEDAWHGRGPAAESTMGIVVPTP